MLPEISLGESLSMLYILPLLLLGTFHFAALIINLEYNTRIFPYIRVIINLDYK